MTDSHSQRAKQNEEYWLCECGFARTSVDSILEHVLTEEHIAELVNDETGERLSILRGDRRRMKYKQEVPDNANVRSGRHGVHDNL